MQDQVIIATVFVAIFAIAQTSSNPLPGSGAPLPPLCEPGIVEEMPAHIKKVCLALENSNQLSSALNQYIRNEAASEFRNVEPLKRQKLSRSITITERDQSLPDSVLMRFSLPSSTALMVRGEDLANPGMAGKRTDVDHVFLRFGRR
jgi:hypothetical protein